MNRLQVLFLTGVAVVGSAAFVSTGFAAAPCVPGTHCVPSGGGAGGGGGGSTGGSVTTPAPKPVPKVTIAAPTLTLSRSVVGFGQPLVLSGKVTGAPAGQLVQLLTETCGFTGTRITAEAKTRADGTFRFTLRPVRNATFSVRYATLSSAAKSVSVRPTVALRRVDNASFQVDVSVGGGSFFSRNATLQRYDTIHHAWRSVGRGRLARSSSVTALVAVSSAQLHAAVPRGSVVRASVGPATLGKCYAPATSAGITS